MRFSPLQAESAEIKKILIMLETFEVFPDDFRALALGTEGDLRAIACLTVSGFATVESRET